MKNTISIAGTEFALPTELSRQPVNEFFTPFWNVTTTCDLRCEISLVSSDPALSDYDPRPEAPWEFRLSNGCLSVFHRNVNGDIVWSYSTIDQCSSISASFNTKIFDQHFFSIDDFLCRDLLLSSLVFKMRENHGLVFHGSASIVGEQGILCVGASGVGKSTISHLLNAAGATILSDERPIARQWPLPEKTSRADFRVYGSPWPSSGGFARNESAPLKRIYFLQHGTENVVTPVEQKESIKRLIHVSTIPWQDPALFDPCLETMEALLANVPAAVLSFRPDEEVVDVIRQDLASERVII